MRADSVSAIGVDIRYVEHTGGGQNPMDVLTNAGILSHGSIYANVCNYFLGNKPLSAVKLYEIHILRITHGKIWSSDKLRLSIHLILSCKMDEFASLWAVVCSSWVRINCFTSCRSLLLPEGDCNKQYIVEANCMMSRLLHFAFYMKLSPYFPCMVVPFNPKSWTHYLIVVTMFLMMKFPYNGFMFIKNQGLHEMRCVLLLGLVQACGGSFLLEQPRSSVMGHFHRMEFLCRVMKVTWLHCPLFQSIAWNLICCCLYSAFFMSPKLHGFKCNWKIMKKKQRIHFPYIWISTLTTFGDSTALHSLLIIDPWVSQHCHPRFSISDGIWAIMATTAKNLRGDGQTTPTFRGWIWGHGKGVMGQNPRLLPSRKPFQRGLENHATLEPQPWKPHSPDLIWCDFQCPFQFYVYFKLCICPRGQHFTLDGFTLRTYPQGFADHLRDLLPDLVGVSEKVEVDETQCPYQLFQNLPFSTWEEARLVPALKYARGNKYLNIPKEWLEVFPSPFEVLHKLEQQRLAQRGQD